MPCVRYPPMKDFEPLLIPRRLAIALLAVAQKADGAEVAGLIGAKDGVPLAVHTDPGATDSLHKQGHDVWARFRSGVGEPDREPGRQLLVSIDTKGVLQLRCWEAGPSGPAPRMLAITD